MGRDPSPPLAEGANAGCPGGRRGDDRILPLRELGPRSNDGFHRFATSVSEARRAVREPRDARWFMRVVEAIDERPRRPRAPDRRIVTIAADGVVRSVKPGRGADVRLAAEEVVCRHASVLMPDPTRGEGPSALPAWLQAG